MQGADARILSYYRDRDVASFTELCRHADYPSDLGAYYIARLVRLGYLDRLKRGTYQVTIQGKQQVIELLASRHLPKFSRIRVIVLLVGQQDGKYICTKRGVQPFLDRVEWPAGEVYTGETLHDALRRIFVTRIGIERPAHFQGFFRRLDMFKGDVFDDKLFAVHTYDLPSNYRLPETSPREQFLKLTVKEMESLKYSSKSLVDILHYIEAAQHDIQERIYELKKVDLLDPETPPG
jgi:hypothetical protein